MALQILHQAEEERLQIADYEAKRGMIWLIDPDVFPEPHKVGPKTIKLGSSEGIIWWV